MTEAHDGGWFILACRIAAAMVPRRSGIRGFIPGRVPVGSGVTAVARALGTRCPTGTPPPRGECAPR